MKDYSEFYIVDAVCGHVGRENAVIKHFVVRSANAKEAAAFVRTLPRVKHDYKFAIRNVQLVSFEDYLIQYLKNQFDPYLNANNIQEQRTDCDGIEVLKMSDLEDSKSYRRKTKVGHKRYLNNYVFDKTELTDYRYVS